MELAGIFTSPQIHGTVLAAADTTQKMIQKMIQRLRAMLEFVQTTISKIIQPSPPM